MPFIQNIANLLDKQEIMVNILMQAFIRATTFLFRLPHYTSLKNLSQSLFV